jgi:hypothetical protein
MTPRLRNAAVAVLVSMGFANPLKRFALIVCCVLFSGVSLAQVTTVYTLLGSYLVQGSRPWYAAWNSSSTCYDSNGNIHRASGGASMTYNIAKYGVVTFNGVSEVTGNLYTAGLLDQAASNLTVRITWSTDGKCTVLSVDNGHAVFKPPVQKSGLATYSLTTDTASGIATGVISAAHSSITFQATGAFVQCFSGSTQVVVLSTIMLDSFPLGAQPNELFFTGTGQHTNTYNFNPCPAT